MARGQRQHYTTPQKALLQRAIKDVEAHLLLSPGGHPLTRRALFCRENIPKTSGFRITASSDPRRRKNSAIQPETRGRPKKLTERDLRRVEIILWQGGYDGRVLTWQHLAIEADLNVCGETLRTALRQEDYRRCKSCRRQWLSQSLKDARVRFARKALSYRPNPTDWKDVRFTDEVHLGYGPQGLLYCTRRPDERECPDCVQEANPPRSEDEKKVHAWAAIGYDYKALYIATECRILMAR